MYRMTAGVGDFDAQAMVDGQGSGSGSGGFNVEAFSHVKSGHDLKEVLKVEIRKKLKEEGPKAAAGACAALGAPPAGPICAKIGAVVAEKVADITDKLADWSERSLNKLFGKKKPKRTHITSADANVAAAPFSDMYSLVLAKYAAMLWLLAQVADALREMQQELFPGTQPWSDDHALKVLAVIGSLPLLPARSEGLDAEALVSPLAGVFRDDEGKLNDAQWADFEIVRARLKAWPVVPPNLSAQFERINAGSGTWTEKAARAKALIDQGDEWLRALDVATASVVTVLAEAAQRNATAAYLAGVKAAADREVAQGKLARTTAAEQRMAYMQQHKPQNKTVVVAASAAAGIGLAWLLTLL
jgi:mannose/fructose-specific phosphotransferase system component IIA